MIQNLLELIYEIISREALSSYFSGVVVVGYGISQFFPEIVEYYVDGKDALFVRKRVNQHTDTNGLDQSKTFIIPFGQTDVAHLFMEGISPSYIEFLAMLLTTVLDEKSDELIRSYVGQHERTVEVARQNKDNQKIVESFIDEFSKYRRKRVVQPILDVVRALPKEELAEMAHALVELTPLRRKVDSRLESVGGPVDIAVISKGDGLIWVKRKHYFNLDKNMDYLYRKFGYGRPSHDEG